MVGALRQSSAEDPSRAVVTLDLTHTYGCMSRQCATQAVRKHWPRMLGVLCTQWERGSTAACLQTPIGWITWYVERGMRQGSTSGEPYVLLGTTPSDR